MTTSSSNVFRVEVVAPASGPAWLEGRSLLEWGAISGTAMNLVSSDGLGAGTLAYSGATWRGAEMFHFGGGHADSRYNGVLGLDLTDDAPAWRVAGAPTALASRAYGVPYYTDGKPAARHTYYRLKYIPARGRLFLAPGVTNFRDTTEQAASISIYQDAWNPDTDTWETQTTWPLPLTGGHAYTLDNSGRMWSLGIVGANGYLYRVDTTTMEWTSLGSPTGSVQSYAPMLYDPVRNRLVRTRSLGNSSHIADLDGYTSGMPTWTTVGTSGWVADGVTIAAGTPYTAFVQADMSWTYCGDLDCYLGMMPQDRTAKVYRFDPDTGVVSLLTLGGVPPPFPISGVDAKYRYFDRFKWVEELHGVVFAYRFDENVYFFRTA